MKIADIAVDSQSRVKETLDADQKKAGQVAGEEKAKNISKVIDQSPKKHPYDGRLVGG